MLQGMLSHYALFTTNTVVLAIALVACGGAGKLPEPPQPTPRLLTGTAQGWTGQNALIEVNTNNLENSTEQHFLAKGTMDRNGAFKVTLPVGDAVMKALYPAGLFNSCRKGQTGVVEVAPNTLEITLAGTLLVFPFTNTDDNSSAPGGLHYLSEEVDTFTVVDRLYASTDGSIKGTCTYSGAALTEIRTFDLTLMAGWNDVVFSRISSPGRVVEITRTGAVPANVRWEYIVFPELLSQ